MEESLSGRENPQQDQTGDDVTGDSGADFLCLYIKQSVIENYVSICVILQLVLMRFSASPSAIVVRESICLSSNCLKYSIKV